MISARCPECMIIDDQSVVSEDRLAHTAELECVNCHLRFWIQT